MGELTFPRHQLYKKGTPAPAETGTGAGTARERPHATAARRGPVLRPRIRRELIRGQLLLSLGD
jgi:hypothetical protein